MEKKRESATIVELSDADNKLLQYRRDRAAAGSLRWKKGNLHRALPLLPYVSPDLTPKEYIDQLDAKQAELQQSITDFEKGHKRSIGRASQIRAEDFNKVRYADHVARAPMQKKYCISPDQFSESDSQIILGGSGDCQIIHGLLSCPTDFIKYKEEGPSQDDSSGEAGVKELFYPAENSIRGKMSITDLTHWYCSDALEMCQVAAVHEYTLPRLNCDSLVNLFINYRAGIHLISANVESAQVWADPVLYISTDNSMPTFADLYDESNFLDGVRGDFGNGNYDLFYPGNNFANQWYAEYKTSFYVKADRPCRVYFGLISLLIAMEGTIEVDPYTYLSYPPGATNVSGSDATPPFWPPKPGVQYLAWPECML